MATKAKHHVKRKPAQQSIRPKRVLSVLSKKAGKLGKETKPLKKALVPKKPAKQAMSVKKKGQGKKPTSASKALKKMHQTIKPKAKSKTKAAPKRPAKPVQRATQQRVELPKDNPAVSTVPQGLPEPTKVDVDAE